MESGISTLHRAQQQVKKCLSIKGAEDIINRPHSFEVSTTVENMFFIADTEKVWLHTTFCKQCIASLQQEKEDWINAVGRAIVKHSRSLIDHDEPDYTTQ